MGFLCCCCGFIGGGLGARDFHRIGLLILWKLSFLRLVLAVIRRIRDSIVPTALTAVIPAFTTTVTTTDALGYQRRSS
jgi:hypothetical protein